MRPLIIAMKLKPIFILPIIFALVLVLCIPAGDADANKYGA